MGSVQGVGNLDPQGDDQLRLHGFARDVMLERYAVQRFHHNESVSVLLADVVNSAGVGIVRNIQREKLERYEAAEAYVLGFVHHSHTTTAKLFQYAVVRDRRAYH